tara:strand:+ start:1201 stop:2040 length:840 start_codon:yes stop_codon:yes gene_type:complete
MEKPSAICTLSTYGSIKDLKIFIYSLRLYEPTIPIHILCDTKTKENMDYFKKDTYLFFYPLLDTYANKNRQEMEQLGIWTEFMLKKCDIIDIVLKKKNVKDVLFTDADICFLNELPIIHKNKYVVGASPHFIKKVDTDKYGYYNGGFLWVGDSTITTKWRTYTKTSRFFEQASIEDIMKEYQPHSFEFPIQNNFGWWRLFQCECPQDRVKQFTVCIYSGEVYYQNKPLRSIHTHLTENTDMNMPYFNSILCQLLEGGRKKNATYAKLLIFLSLVKKNLV